SRWSAGARFCDGLAPYRDARLHVPRCLPNHRKDAAMSDTQYGDWTQPAAMAIPKGGVFKDKVQQGRYGPIFPKTPACYGFRIIAKIIPGREPAFYEYARNVEK